MEKRWRQQAALLCVVVVGIFFGILVPVLAAGATHPFAVQDLVTLQRIGAPAPSPDGNWIVFPLRSTDLVNNTGLTSLWIIRPDGTGLSELTFPPGNDASPCWSPDSSVVYYLSTRSGSSQVWSVSPSGADPVQVTDLPLDISNLKISSDGKTLAFSMGVFPKTRYEETAARLFALENQKSSGKVYERLPVRHWDTYEDGRRNHIFVMTLSTGKPVDVMNAMDADSPSEPFGGAEEYTFTPDNAGIVFSAADTGREEMWTTEHSLYYASVTGTAAPVNLTPGNKAWATQPVFSPGGKTLAYLAMTRPGYESDRYRIMLREWPDGTDREVAASWDRSPLSLLWSPDGRTLYVTAMDDGNCGLFAIDPATGEIRTLVKKGTVSSVSTFGNNLVYSWANQASPADLFTINPDGTHAERITQANND